MGWGIVMMQLPIAGGPQVRSLAPNYITKMMDDFQTVFFVDSLAFGCITQMHNLTTVKENSQQHLDFAPPPLCSFGPWG
jgi:hypothetical protein